MERAEARLERGHTAGSGLDDELLLAVVLELPFPAIDRAHRRQNVHAGGEPLLDQRARECDGVGVGADRREDDCGGPLYFFAGCAIYHLYFVRKCGTRHLYSRAKRAIVAQPPVTPSSSTRTPEPQPAHRRRRRAVEYLVLLVGTMLLVDAFVGDKGLLAMMAAREQYRLLEQSLAEARAENARLREEAGRLREDPAAIEEIARRELGLIRPGEKLFIIRDVESR